jgi:adenine-specific DNA-methyltransferase
MFKYRLKTYWKPAIWFSKGEGQPDQVRTPWIHDIVSDDHGSKIHHKWEQGVDEFSHFIDGLTYPGKLVVDPFVGSGTVAIACKLLNRRFVGCDEDEASVNMTLTRLSQERNLKEPEA